MLCNLRHATRYKGKRVSETREGGVPLADEASRREVERIGAKAARLLHLQCAPVPRVARGRPQPAQGGPRITHRHVHWKTPTIMANNAVLGPARSSRVDAREAVPGERVCARRVIFG